VTKGLAFQGKEGIELKGRDVIALKESKSRPDAGVVTFLHRCLNQRNELVCQTERAALLKKA
jgi:acyl dehydratase